jgi:mutator protein MutT
MTKHIHVAAAVIVDQSDKIVIAKRPKHSDMELLWEFPGGKLEEGETPEKALVRELKEELNINAECDELMHQETYQYPTKKVTLHFIKVTKYSGKIEALEHEEIRWISVNEIDDYDFPPADDHFLEILKKTL